MNKHPQKATLWRKDGSSWDGSVTWQRIDVYDTRWEDEQRLIQSNDSRMITSRSVVYFPKDVFQIGDMLAEGEFNDLSPVNTAYEIKDKLRTPNLSGTRYEFKAVV